MAIVAIKSSPRKSGNSEALVNAMIEGARANGKEVIEFRLNGMGNAKGCQACMACKRSVGCITKDDNGKILEAIRDSEGVILSSPCYFGEVNGQFKLLEDRFYSFINADFSPNIAPGKKVAVVVTCGGGYDGAKAMADKLEGTMSGMLGFVPVGKIVAAFSPTESAADNANLIAEAKAIGNKL